MLSFFTGRSNRQEYWISVALLIVVALILTVLHMEAAGAAITVMWVITWMRRLHDIGKPGWWAAVPIVLMILVVMAGFLFGGQPFVNALAAMERMETAVAVPDRMLNIILAVGLAAVIIQFGFTIWLGTRKGDEGQNRFGPPAPDLFKRS
ncbi:MAG TPA: DUF805 domain-containing protein [Rhizomicrobium sp.]|jgi:uncharacterized membrane protein YhaH (DUF805 family)